MSFKAVATVKIHVKECLTCLGNVSDSKIAAYNSTMIVVTFNCAAISQNVCFLLISALISCRNLNFSKLRFSSPVLVMFPINVQQPLI